MPKVTVNPLKTIQRQQQFLAMLVFALVAVGMWVAGSIGRSQRSTGIDPELLELAKPLTPFIDEDALALIERKRAFSTSELTVFPILVIVEDEQGRRILTSDQIRQETATKAAQAALQESTSSAQTQVASSSSQQATPFDGL